MAEKTISTRQKQKYDTSSNWTANNIVLLAGEIGIESDTNKFKVGNGTSAWNELDYAGGSEIPLYSTTGQNTDGAMTQKATTDALPQAVTVTLTESQDFNDIVITNEQFELLLSNPENYLIIETSNGSLTISLKYRRSQYTSMSVEGASQEMLIFNCVNSTSLSFAPYAQRIDSLTVIKQTQNGESVIVVTDDTLDFTTFVPNNRTINGKSLANNITLTATDVNALPDTTEIPTALSDLTEDSTHRTVTDSEKNTWNAKSDFSGSYNDLTDKPTIPTINVNGTPQSTLNFDSDPQTQIDARVKTSDLLNLVYPINSIYMSVNSTNPSTLFGGTWEQFAQGRVLLGIGSNGETNYTTAEQTGGSENSVASHTHTQQEHNHTQQAHKHALLSNTKKNANANGFGANNNVYGISGVWQDSAPATQYYTVDNAGLAYVKSVAAINNSTTAVNNSTGEAGGNRMPFIT